MKSQVTNIEQSRQLLELGVLADNASMAWIDREYLRMLDYEGDVDYEIYPAFTVMDLLSMIPKVLESSRSDMMLYLSITSDGEMWELCWINHATRESAGETFRSNDLVSLLCDRIEWLVSNGYKLEE